MPLTSTVGCRHLPARLGRMGPRALPPTFFSCQWLAITSTCRAQACLACLPGLSFVYGVLAACIITQQLRHLACLHPTCRACHVEASRACNAIVLPLARHSAHTTIQSVYTHTTTTATTNARDTGRASTTPIKDIHSTGHTARCDVYIRTEQAPMPRHTYCRRHPQSCSGGTCPEATHPTAPSCGVLSCLHL